MNYLMEDFLKKGTDAQQFFTACEDMDAHTRYIRTKAPELLSFKGEDTENGKVLFKGCSVAFSALEKELNNANEAEAVYNDIISTKAPIIMDHKNQSTPYMSTNKAVAEIAALRGLHGTPINIPSEKRDSYVTELADNLSVTFVCRNVGTTTKVLSTRSAKFGPIPMATLKNVYDGFMSSDWIGSYEVKGWEITQDEGHIIVEFPELASNMKTQYPQIPDSWVPGVIFSNGTTGYCTLNAKMTYRKETPFDDSRRIIIDAVAAKHFAGFTPDRFINKMKNECWGKYTQLPEKLETAAGIAIAPENIEKEFEKVFKFIRLNRVFQKKDTETCKYLERIRERALLDIKPIPKATLYDIVSIVMGLPEEVVVPEAYKTLLEESCGRAWQYEA